MFRRRISGWLLSATLGLALHCGAALSADAQQFNVDGVSLALDFADADFAHGTEPLTAWVKRSAGIVAAYYGHFPVPQLRIRVSSVEGSGVHHGTTYGAHGGPRRHGRRASQ